MSEPVVSTIEKALSINLDPLHYGTIVEIGAGQEVARWFFQAGAAAGTIAKSMSAYDMVFSDEIYGASPDKRYVSRSRLERMLEREYELTVERVADHRSEDSRYFAFANTVAAQSYNKRSECHGWLGIKLQTKPQSAPDEIILHVRMLDDTNLEQQEAIGILGVNLIHGAYNYADDPKKLINHLKDNIKWGRIEIDLIEFNGPNFDHIDNSLMALELVHASLVRAVLFSPDGKVVIPSDALYKHRILAMRGKFETVEQRDIDRFTHAKARFEKRDPGISKGIISLAEMSMSSLANEEGVDVNTFLSRVNQLCEAGYHVLISELYRYFRVRQFLARYTAEEVALVSGARGVKDIFQEENYEGLAGGVLEGLGQTFTDKTIAYIYPVDNKSQLRISSLPVSDSMRPLVSYLHDNGQIELVKDF
ncbi:TonB-dependent receptor [Terasakiella sp. SH-1]|uniref:TonB-dependent receptor n=1 Tax=Terasakiella sp. SH-1 TaxID=2560057 RepID=UPI001073E307|nr:TonB-dependent receptor [Terasakiella sp. SH-1]